MSTKTERRKEQRKMNYRVMRDLTASLMGQTTVALFTADCSKKTGDRVLRINQGRGNVNLDIYFGTRIYISVKGNAHASYDERYAYYDEYASAVLPDDIYEYIRITTAFLKELIRHTNAFRNSLHGVYFNGSVPKDLVMDAPDTIRDVVSNRFAVLEHHWTWNEREDIEYITKCMQNQRYRRARGDYQL